MSCFHFFAMPLDFFNPFAQTKNRHRLFEEICMPYTAEVSRLNPSCLLFLIDQSGSMADPAGRGDGVKRKADAVADSINRLLQNTVIKCAKAEGVRDYYHVGVLGCGNNTVHIGFEGKLQGQDLVRISEVAMSPARIEERIRRTDDGNGGIIEQKVKFPVWFDPVAVGGTPMCKALADARRIIKDFLEDHRNCFPPIVINITDGESTDGDPSSAAQELTSLASSDGNVLFFNLHLSGGNSSPLEFPDAEDSLPNDFSKLLFKASSPLPQYMQSIALQEGFPINPGARGFVFNADIVSLIRFLDIGTRPSNLR